MSEMIPKNGDGLEKKTGSRFEYVPSYNVTERGGGARHEILDAKKVLSLLLRHKWLVLIFVVLGGTAAWFYADTIDPTYESSGAILISSGASQDDELSRIISQTTGIGTRSTIANEIQVLQSREFARLVALRLMEEEPGDEEAFPVLWTLDEDENIVRASEASVTNRIRRGLSVIRPERESDVLNLYFRSTSPSEAAYIVNTAMDIYVESSTLQNRQAAESTAEFLESEKEEIKRKLDLSEQRLRDYMDNTGIVQVSQQATGIVNQRTEVEVELQRVGLELNTIREAITNHERQLERIRPGLSEEFSEAIGPRIRNSQEQLALYENERTLIIQRNPGVLERAQTPPRLQYLNNQIDRLKNDIRQLSSQLFTEDDEFMGMDTAERAQMLATIQTRLVELRIEQNQYQSRKSALEERRLEIERSFGSLPDEMVELARLQRDVTINEELFLNVSRKYADMSVLKQSQFGFGRIIDTALIPNQPVSPNRNLILAIGMMLGGIFIVGIAIAIESFDNSINNIDLLKDFHLPLLSAVPVISRVPKRKKQTFEVSKKVIPDELVLLRDRNNLVSESVRRLKNNLVYQFGHLPPKKIAITSPEKGDGKSTIASNLAVAFAEDGYKTLVVDTDFRRSNLHTYFGIENDIGLSDYLMGKSPIINIFKNTDLINLKVISTGKAAINPEHVVNSKEFNKFMGKMDELFDVILFDTPPYGIISDSTSLLKFADATVLVTRYRKTNRGVFLNTIEELERIGANVCGIVLNEFDHKKENGHRYGPGYYESMYRSYEAYVDER
jgi:capsular exopolysaccharide synthesis family protein